MLGSSVVLVCCSCLLFLVLNYVIDDFHWVFVVFGKHVC